LIDSKHVLHNSHDGKQVATIKNNTADENFDVVKVGEKFVLIQSRFGFVFDGQLSHAGAAVNYPGFIEGAVVTEVENLVSGLSETTTTNTLQRFENVFNALCKVKNFDKITRFHALIMPNDEEIQQAPNAVREVEPITDF
jgi:hypothetical protein